MVATCNSCGKVVGTPVAVGCVTTGLPASVLTGVLYGFLIRVSPWFMLSAVPFWALLAWLFWEGPRWLAATRNRFRTCPQCGRRDWSSPRYSGFGL
jgi:hypothetical protein